MEMNAHEFYLATIGKAFDVDGVYGAQCVDLFNYFNKIMNGGIYINCQPSGYAYSIFENRANNGSLKYYDVVTDKNKLQDGDWVIWSKCSQMKDSHIAMFRKDNGDGTAVFLGQNQGGAGGSTTQRNWRYDGMLGALRPKQYVKSTNYNNSSDTGVHVVVSGDTLSGIASKYGTTTTKLVEMNGISNPNLIKVGEKITYPISSGSSTSSITTGKTLSLKNAKLYASSSTGTVSNTISGTYYVWSKDIVNGRVRITNTPARVGVSGQITGWISQSDI